MRRRRSARRRDIGWKPSFYLVNVSISVDSVLKPAGLENCQGIITAAYYKDPTDAQWAKTPDFVQWKAFMDKYMPGANQGDAFYTYAYAVAATMQEVLKRCGNELTRENLMKQVASMKDVEIPLLLPGIKLNTSATDFYPIQSMQLQRFEGDTWKLFGNVISSEAS